MLVAVSDWEGRISPVFDVAERLLLVKVAAGQCMNRHHEPLTFRTPIDMVHQLVNWKIEIILCGGVSRNLQQSIEQAGIKIIPHLCGNVDAVLQAFLEKRFPDERFTMPGCCGKLCMCRKRNLHHHKVNQKLFKTPD